MFHTTHCYAVRPRAPGLSKQSRHCLASAVKKQNLGVQTCHRAVEVPIAFLIFLIFLMFLTFLTSLAVLNSKLCSISFQDVNYELIFCQVWHSRCPCCHSNHTVEFAGMFECCTVHYASHSVEQPPTVL